MSEPFIRLIDVSKVFYWKDNPIIALKRTNVAFRRGEFVSLVGPSGSGKTTLLSLIAGIIKPTKGRVILGGRDITALTEDERAILRRTQLGFIFQAHNLIGPLTAYENVEIPLLIAGLGSEERVRRVSAAMQVTETLNLEGRTAKDLSGGEQQRIAIARGIVMNPPILLADEPTGDLDTETGSRIMEALKVISEEGKVTIIVATHDMMLVRESSRILRIRDGWLTEDGADSTERHPAAALSQ